MLGGWKGYEGRAEREESFQKMKKKERNNLKKLKIRKKQKGCSGKLRRGDIRPFSLYSSMSMLEDSFCASLLLDASLELSLSPSSLWGYFTS